MVLLFSLCQLVLLLTIVPTVYTLDSAELVSASATLGFVHAPGYPLYLIIAHLFTLLPIRDVFFRVTLFTAICLASTACLVFSLVRELLRDRLIALGAALTLVWSYYVWMSGLFPEVYAPQLLTIALCAWQLARMWRRHDYTLKQGCLLGTLTGIAVAMTPQSILLGIGLVLALSLMGVPWRVRLIAGTISVAVVLLILLYFPIRFAAHPAFNSLGIYDVNGIFHAVPLDTADGILDTLRGVQFERMFFSEGFLPSASQLLATGGWLWSNFLGVGLIISLIGVGIMAAKSRGLFLVWLSSILPYTYFYTTYGATDRQTMFGPTYLLVIVAFAYGLHWLTQDVKQWKWLCILVLPILMLVVNFPLLNLSQETSVRTAGEALLVELPQNADVFGDWYEVFPLQYLQSVEGWRGDIRLYPIFSFEGTLMPFVDAHSDPAKAYSDRPVIFLSAAVGSSSLDGTRYQLNSLPNNREAIAGAPITGGYLVTPRSTPDTIGTGEKEAP